MKTTWWTSLTVFVMALGCDQGVGAEAKPSSGRGIFCGWSTNGPTVYEVYTNPPPLTEFTNAQGMVFRRPQSRLMPKVFTNLVFNHFVPESLNYTIFTNVTARTNRGEMKIWSVRTRPPDWPTNAPVVQWNTRGLMWGMKGLTALSPSWEVEGSPGQVPITALTRRHGYTRGHSMGPEGFHTTFAGKKVWFVSSVNKMVEVRVAREVVRNRGEGITNSYTILLFDRDLPASIQPVRVIAMKDSWAKFPIPSPGPWVLFQTEQAGFASTGLPGFSMNVAVGGDSGSADLLPIGQDLVLFGGRDTSGPSAEMQADMDQLCRLEKLNPRLYQMDWFDASAYPAYSQ